MFRPQLWPSGGEYWGNPFNWKNARAQDVREVWFTGSHGDIGGGYPESKSELAKVPLKWMIEQTGAMGLHYIARTVEEVVLGANPAKPYVKPNAKGDSHNSMTWGWAILEFLPRIRPRDSQRSSIFGLTLPLFERRNIPSGAIIHRSVVERAGSVENLSQSIPKRVAIEG